MSRYLVLVLLVAAERLAELITARRNAAWSRRRGAVEYGRGHYPAMVLLHTALLAGCLAEPALADRPFLPALGWPMLALALAAQALRWWCIGTLGPRWNTRVLVVPGLSLVATGPYRLLRHPNYLAVVVEGAALPLVHCAWLTATGFTLLNLPLLAVRLRCENAALRTAPTAVPALDGAPA
ncbi:isoprenylcysteine carboxylmethyltransferase family protein [Kitasatospora nipponensis]|uniref:Isoprenylcysteine carboxylmethyltransferase family protein n=1 Tax=Kitasatospora nipponensis TaxID=258049 RepID=A0ABP4HCK2_9ACTN